MNQKEKKRTNQKETDQRAFRKKSPNALGLRWSYCRYIGVFPSVYLNVLLVKCNGDISNNTISDEC
jgi:hypothetical protein